jgi:hypothetical protein
MAMRIFLIALAGIVLGVEARANGLALFNGAAPLLASAPSDEGTASPSLFAGTRSGSFFAPLPPRAPPPSRMHGNIADLLSLIARAEAGPDGYDAINHGARIRTQRPPSQMTLGEIYAWIVATPGQPHAIGRYQFIPDTLRHVAQVSGFGPETVFSPDVQDALALVLLEEAGLREFEAGQVPRRSFMAELAQIWAGLPLPSGRSHYEGYAGNSATMSWAEFESGLARIWPTG